MLGAKADDGVGLFGTDAGELEELRGIGEVDSDSVRHGGLLHTSNARSDRVVASERCSGHLPAVSASEVIDQVARDAVARGQAREIGAPEPARVLELLG